MKPRSRLMIKLRNERFLSNFNETSDRKTNELVTFELFTGRNNNQNERALLNRSNRLQFNLELVFAAFKLQSLYSSECSSCVIHTYIYIYIK